MDSSKRVSTFNGKGDVNVFLAKVDLYNKLKKYDGETAAVSLASRLEEPAFNVYLRMSEADRKDEAKIKTELRKQYEVGNRDREEALFLLSAVQRKEEETAKDFVFCTAELVKLAYPTFNQASKDVHEKDSFVKGLHPEMQTKLKTLANFADLDMKGILDNTVRLEVAGVRAVARKYKDDVNAVSDIQGGSCSSSEKRLLDRLDSMENAIAKLSVETDAATVNVNETNASRRGRFVAGSTKRKCWNCGERSHLVKKCPKRFCQACGQNGHDAWIRNCPKFS